MPKIDAAALPFVAPRGGYPAPYDTALDGRSSKRLGARVGLTQFGVNLARLAPGAMSSLRHWHETPDEFVYVVEGELILIENGARPCCGRAMQPASRRASPTGTIWSTAPPPPSFSRSAPAR